jgi:hypothetical protein
MKVNLMSPVEAKAVRRQIAAEFKQRSVPRGVYVIRCSATGRVWAGSSPNLNAVQNSLWFQLRGGLSRHASLQAAWKQYGESTFTLEVLERFDDDLSPLLLNQQLNDRKKARGGSLGAELL